MNIVDELRWRDLLQDISDEEGLSKLPKGTPFYVGFDPTAPSLQLGNLIPLLVATNLGRMGYKPIILFGGATGSIGDPSGKNKERPLLELEKIENNVRTQTSQVTDMLGRAGVSVEFVNNRDWTKDVTFIDFLRDVGKYMTINYMVSKELVKKRLAGDGISYAEFSYMLLQANDYLHLYNTKGCKLEFGGSDQWGNITTGLELIRKKGLSDAYAFSIKLLLDSNGQKFGKSAGNAIWLKADMTSPFKLHQFLLNSADADVEKYLKALTLYPQEKIAEICAAHSEAPEKRIAQTALADFVCEFVHGSKAVEDAKRGAAVLFGGSMEGLSEEALADIFQDVPSTECPASELSEMAVIDLFVKTGLVKSKGEARRLVTNGGAYLHGVRIEDAALMFKDTPQANARFFVLRSGKKNYHAIKVL